MSEITPEVEPSEEITPSSTEEKQPESKPETGGDEVIQLPDDHPLVKTLAAQKDKIKQLQVRAQRADELEQAQMTDAEKAAARLQAAEKRAGDLERAIALKDLVIEHKLSKDDSALLEELTEHVTDTDAMKRIAVRLAADADKKPGHGLQPNPAQSLGDDAPTDEDAFARQFFFGKKS